MAQSLRVIVVGLGSAGDVHPMVGLALELRRRGHEVVLVAPEPFAALAHRLGLEFEPVLSGAEIDSALKDPNAWHPTRAFFVVARRLVIPSVRPVYEIIRRRMVPGRTVAVASGITLGARIAQEHLGVPLATAHLQPIMLRSVIRPACYGFPDVIAHLPRSLRRLYLAAADRFLIDPALASAVNAFRAELGLPPVARLLDRWVHSPQLVLGLFPEWYAPPAPDWPPNVVLTGFPLWDEREVRPVSPELEAFLAAGEPPLAFTAGSAMMQGHDFFRVSVEACRRAGRRALLLTQHPEQLPATLPAGVRHVSYAPFSTLLPRCAALVHHGGIGTSAQALAAGIPQLVVPFAHDQPDNAMHLRHLGVAEMLPARRYSTRRLAGRLAALQAPSLLESCRRHARRMAGRRAIPDACAAIEALVQSAGESLA